MSINVGDLNARVKLDTRDFTTGLRRVNLGFDTITRQAMQLNQTLELIGKGLRIMEAFGQTMLDAGLRAERLNTAFKSITGDANAAKAEMEFLQRTADDLGQEFYTLAEGYKGLAAASKGTNMEGQQTREIFLAVTQAGTALKMSNDAIDGSLRAISQMMSKGTVQAEELRGQLGERLPGAFQLAAKSMGMTTAELGKALEQGKVLASEMLPRLARVLKHQYADGARQAATSTQASLNRMTNAWERLKLNFSDTEFMEGVAKAVDEVADQLTDPETQRQMREYGKAAGEIAKTFGEKLVPTLSDAVAAMQEMNDLWNSIPATLKGVVGGAAVGSRGGPWGAILGGLGGGLAGYELGKTTQEQIDDAWERIQQLKERVRSGPSILEQAIGIDQENLDKALAAAWTEYRALHLKLAKEQQKAAQAAQKAASGTTTTPDASTKRQPLVMDNPLKASAEAIQRTADQMARLNEFTKQHQLIAGGIPEWQQQYIDGYHAQAEAMEKQLVTQQDEIQLLGWKKQGLTDNEIALKRINRQYEQLNKEWPELSGMVEELQASALAAESLRQSLDLANSDSFVEGWNAGIEEIKQGFESMGEVGKQIALDMSESMADTFSTVFGNAIDGQMQSWTEYVTDFLNSIAKAIGNQMAQQAATGIMGMMGFAQGGAFSGGKVVPFAHGGINPGVPQLFPMANGSVGLWGEAGPEAILPLTRLPGGDLGVQANVGGAPTEFNVKLVNESGHELEVTSADSYFDGQRYIATVIMEAVTNNVEGLGDFLGRR